MQFRQTPPLLQKEISKEMNGHWPSIKEFKGRFLKIPRKAPVTKVEDGAQDISSAKLKRPRMVCKIPLSKHISGDNESSQCIVCKEIHTSRHKLGVHMKSHFLRPPFTCKACKSVFVSYEAYDEHDIEQHRKGKVCELCSEPFLRRTDLKSHLASQHQLKTASMITCAVCRDEFATNAGLERHMRSIHIGSGKHGCETCPMRFSDEFCLARHVLYLHTSYSRKDLIKFFYL